jgi:hypothetical protein
LLVTVSLSKQELTLYDQGVPIATSQISSGTPHFPTPTGVFTVIQKQWFHRSNLYSAAPMPFMQRLTWSGVALHAGELPGYPASHGCIRLPEDFAVRLWGTTQIATRVIVTYGEVKPVPFAHARLFTPKQKPKPDASDTPMALRQPAPDNDRLELPTTEPLARVGHIAVSSVPITAASLDRAAASQGLDFLASLRNQYTVLASDGTPTADTIEASDDDDEISAVPQMQRRPQERAQISIVRPGRPNEVLEVTEAPDITEQGTATVTVMRSGRAAEIEVIAIDRVAPATQLAMPVTVPEPPVAVAHNGGMLAPASARRDLPVKVEPPRAMPAAPQPEFHVTLPPAPADTGSVAGTPREATPAQPPAAATTAPEMPVASEPTIEARAGRSRRDQQAHDPVPTAPPAPQARPLRPGPISVFVSRKERRMFVRKGFEPLFDAPVTIADPERALGSHVFTAISVNETEARWNVVSLPSERTRLTYRSGDERHPQRRTRRNQTDVVSQPPSSPAEALDRIEMPNDAVARISELLSPGAALIVSDEGLGRETGRETDFTVVLTK